MEGIGNVNTNRGQTHTEGIEISWFPWGKA
ncbi:hypothetical protein Gotur_020337 [Gossypium turneri]